MKNLLKLFWIWILLVPVFSQEKSGSEDVDAFLFMDIPVVTSTLSEIKLSEAPSNMTVISAAEIEAMGCQTLMDILEKAGGILVTRNNYGFYMMSIRGIYSKFANDKIKLLLNGHTISEPFQSSYTFFFNIAADNIKQVEILRGPGSCLYGTNAFSGIINVLTRNSSSGEGSQLNAHGGSDNTCRANYNYSKKPGEDQELNFNTDFSKTDGPELTLQRDALYGTPFSAAPSKVNEANEEKRIYSDYRYKNFSLMASYSDVEMGVPVGRKFLTQNQETNYIKFGFLEAKYDLKFSDNSILTLKTSGDWADFLVKGQYFPNGIILYGDVNSDGILEPLDTNNDGQIESFPNGAYAQWGYKTREYRTELLWKYLINDSNQLLIGTLLRKS